MQAVALMVWYRCLHRSFVFLLISYSECAYGFRFVELNRRTQASADNPNYDPWSVRQSAVYQQYDKDKRRTMFILITPSESVKKRVGELLSRGSSSKERLNAFNMHCILLGTLHENWRLYLRTLEGLVTRQVWCYVPKYITTIDK